MKFEKKKTPVNQIKISGTEILNIDLNQGWEITNLEFDNTCTPNWIDLLTVTFEKQKRGEYKMHNEQNIGTTQTANIGSTTINPPKMVGWICPVCGRGLSPYTTICPCKGWIDGKWEVTC